MHAAGKQDSERLPFFLGFNFFLLLKPNLFPPTCGERQPLGGT
jgi:hypothetical protein